MNADPDESMDVRDPSGKVCGRYHYRGLPNPPKPFYKSYFNGLCTPKGCNVVAPQPCDHPHHHGLQYGLCAKDVNFWEEDGNSADGPLPAGTQTTRAVRWLGSAFLQEIAWQDDKGDLRFVETRNVSVKPTTSGSGYVWTWQTTLTAGEHDVELIVSAWPVSGHGYCGLGLRLMPELFLNKSKVTYVHDSAGVLERVTVQGTEAALTFEQDTKSQRNVLYIQGCDPNRPDKFAFVSLGPTNDRGFTVKSGQELKGSYRITVADVT